MNKSCDRCRVVAILCRTVAMLLGSGVWIFKILLTDSGKIYTSWIFINFNYNLFCYHSDSHNSIIKELKDFNEYLYEISTI